MTKASKPGKATRIRHSPQFKSEALALAERVGVSRADKQLGLHSSQLYNGRSKARLQQDRGEAEQQLATENARLKRQLAEQAEELAILKKRRRTSPRASSEVRLHAAAVRNFPHDVDVSGVWSFPRQLLCLAATSA